MFVKKSSFLSFALMTILVIAGMPVQAQEWEESVDYSAHNFQSKWEDSATLLFEVESGVTYAANFTYGYDTWWVKEDYVTNVGGTITGCYCKGKVTNSEGTAVETGPVLPGYRSGKADVEHTGMPTYSIIIWFQN